MTDKEKLDILRPILEYWVARRDCDGQLCWCHLSMGEPSKSGLHTGYCHQIRKALKKEVE